MDSAPIIADEPIDLSLPLTRPGPRTKAILEDRARFAESVRNLVSAIGFSPSARGLQYAAEEYGLLKHEFDKFQKLLNSLRDSGELPLNITSADDARAFTDYENIDCPTAGEEVESIEATIDHWVDNWTPVSFWDGQDTYLIMVVEKIDLVGLFDPICKRFRVSIANARGWSDKHLRAYLILKCRPHIDAGRRVVVLYCGNFDPAGMLIGKTLPKNLLDMDGTFYDHSLSGGSGIERVELSPGEIEVDRFGLNYDLIERLGLSWVDNLFSGSREEKGREKFPLNDPRHKCFKLDYVQDYLRDYCDGYIGKDGFYHTDMPRKVEANALLVNKIAAHELCEAAITKYIDPDSVDEHEEMLAERRVELRELVEERLGGTTR